MAAVSHFNKVPESDPHATAALIEVSKLAFQTFDYLRDPTLQAYLQNETTAEPPPCARGITFDRDLFPRFHVIPPRA